MNKQMKLNKNLGNYLKINNLKSLMEDIMLTMKFLLLFLELKKRRVAIMKIL